MEEILHIQYALGTFHLLLMGVLAMFMAAGFSMLEAGLARARNTSQILTKNIALYSVASIMYLLVGYNLMYMEGGMESGGWIPGFGWLVGEENTAAEVLAGTAGGVAADRSARAGYFFQVVFVIVAMSIVSGAVAERMRLWAFLAFAVVMTGFIYPVQGMWAWGGGWLAEAGYWDFAGAGVVHLCGAAAALAGVLLVGPRAGKYRPDGAANALPGCNMPLATLGMFVLWFGWFGFNGGSRPHLSTVEDANAIAQVFVNTNIAACGGLIAALVLARTWFGKADLTMALNGALAGLVAITAEPLAPEPFWAMAIGAVGGVLALVSIVFLDKLKIDDPVGAISAHGVCGVWGVLAVVFNNADATLGGQLLGVMAIFGWAFGAALFVWWLLKVTVGIRVAEEDELTGVDLAETGIEAYPEFSWPQGRGAGRR